MFGISRLTGILIAAGLTVATIYGIGYNKGQHSVQVEFDAYKAQAQIEMAKLAAQTRDTERTMQSQSNQIQKDKQHEINAINRAAAAVFGGLRLRPTRDENLPSDSRTTESCDGSQLYRNDAEFLVREAERADEVMAELKACYQAYDSVKSLTDSQ
jgi:acyl CoA:acetate/3-ketoacid CoA transferase alpha subunit